METFSVLLVFVPGIHWLSVNSPHKGQWCGALMFSLIQYIPRNMHTVFALLCFVVVIHWLMFPYPSGLLHWHCGNLTIAPVPAKQPWWIWINTSCEFIMNDYITTTKQSTTKPCAYFLGYTVCAWIYGWLNSREAGDLRCHRVHYVVTVVILSNSLRLGEWCFKDGKWQNIRLTLYIENPVQYEHGLGLFVYRKLSTKFTNAPRGYFMGTAKKYMIRLPQSQRSTIKHRI